MVGFSYPILDLALVALVAGILFSRGTRPPAFWLLCGFLVAQLAADSVYMFASLNNTY